MRWLIWAVLLPSCLTALGLIAWWSYQRFAEVFRFDRARDQFRLQREWLEARFLNSLTRTDPIERLRWEDAHWRDEIVWARDRKSRRLLALIEVHFDPDPFDDLPDHPPRLTTVLFEYHKGHWTADGRRLDEIRPSEAFLRDRQFEPVALPPTSPRRV